MAQAQTQNPEIENFRSQVQNLIERSIRERRTTVVIIRYRNSMGYFNYQTRLVIIIKPILRWEEEEAPAMLVDIPLSIFDNISLEEIESIIESIKPQYEDVYIEKISFF